MIKRRILYIVVLILIMPPAVQGQIQISGILDLAHTLNDKPDRYDTQFRGDNAFNTIRSKIFFNNWISDNIGIFTEVWYDDGASTSSGGDIRLEGAFIVFTNFITPGLNLKVGKFAQPFGTYYLRTYSNKNPLIGAPLIYSYHTAASGSQLSLENRFQKDHKASAAVFRQFGLPVIYDVCWDTGIELYGAYSRFEYMIAVTNSAISSIRARNNKGKQIAGRIGFRPTFGLKLGVSYAHAPYLSNNITPYSPDEPAASFPQNFKIEDFKQNAFGIDLEFSRGYLDLHAEYVRNKWDVIIDEKELANTGWYIEPKYKLTPRLYAAVRYDQMIFDEIGDGEGGKFRWDYDLVRIEGGLGYKISKDITLKIVRRGYYFNGNHNLDEDTTAFQLAIMF